jgi:hypothetical protein
VRGTQNLAGRDEDSLVPGAADLEEDFILALELDLAVVQPPRKLHCPVHPDELIAAQSMEAAGIKVRRFGARL